MRPKLSYANVVATLALFIALGGASYAAIKLPKNSVGAKQLKRGAVTPPKLSKSAFDLLHGQPGNQGPEGKQGPPGASGTDGTDGTNGTNGSNGTARAYAEVYPRAYGDCGEFMPPPQPCEFARAKGIESVTYTATGTYCVVAPGIDPSQEPAVVSVYEPGTTSPSGNASAMFRAACNNSTGFQVRTERIDPTTAMAEPDDTVSFDIVIP
jgi:hypothetical protein